MFFFLQLSRQIFEKAFDLIYYVFYKNGMYNNHLLSIIELVHNNVATKKNYLLMRINKVDAFE